MGRAQRLKTLYQKLFSIDGSFLAEEGPASIVTTCATRSFYRQRLAGGARAQRKREDYLRAELLGLVSDGSLNS